jgi:hypothetical protein
MTKHPVKKLSEQIDVGVKTAIAEAIERHRKLGESISILKDGKVVTLTAEEITWISSTISSLYIILL